MGGNLQTFDEDRLAFLIKARDDFGDLVRFDSRTTLVNNIDLARIVLKGPDRRFQITENFVQRRLSAEEIDAILAGRSLLNPGLRRSAVEGVVPLVATLLTGGLESTSSRPVDPMSVLEAVTSRAVATYYFGAEAGDLPARCSQLLDALAEVIGNPFALPMSWRSRARRDIDRLHADLNRRVADRIVRRLDAVGHYSDGAAVVAAGAVRATNPPSLERLADLVIGAMLAAHRVPAASAAWLLYELTERTDVFVTLRRELAALVGPDGALDVRRAASSLQVRACIYENLRLHPPTWLVSRRAADDVELRGLLFRRGHNFVVSPYVLGRDHRLFTDPESFRPERWTGGEASHASLAFGYGPHACPGSHFATQLLATVLVVIADRFDLHRAPGLVTADARTTLQPRGLRLTFTPAATMTGDAAFAR